jgi:hypothetical protein
VHELEDGVVKLLPTAGVAIDVDGLGEEGHGVS